MTRLMCLVIFFLFFNIGIIETVPATIETISFQGDLEDSLSITINGNNFGSNGPNFQTLEWFGGKNGNIEEGNVNSEISKELWSSDPNAGGFTNVVYSDLDSYSHSKSLRSNVCCGKWASGFHFHADFPITDIYATWRVIFKPQTGQGGQWKMWRLRSTSSVNDDDNEIMSSRWINTDHTSSMFYVMISCNMSGFDVCYPNNNGGLRWLGDGPMPYEWSRIEYFAKASSQPCVKDGELFYAIHRPNNIKVVADYSPIVTHKDDINWEYVYFQNYWGNNNADDIDVFIDDIFISFGSKCRIEVGNTQNFTTNTKREIQIPTEWSNDEITFQFNPGRFSSDDDLYLYIINNQGEVNNIGVLLGRLNKSYYSTFSGLVFLSIILIICI